MNGEGHVMAVVGEEGCVDVYVWLEASEISDWV